MKNRTVCAYFNQMGGVNALHPVFCQLIANHRLVISCRPEIRAGIENSILKTALFDGSASEFVENTTVDLLITDTMDLTRYDANTVGNKLWQLCSTRHIPTIAYVDSWWFYRERFTKQLRLDLEDLPYQIAILDEHMNKDMKKLGFPEDRMVILGNPQFDLIYQFRHKVKNTKQFTLVFVSEPIEKFQGPTAMETWGFTEKTTLDLIVGILNAQGTKFRQDLKFVVMLHPEDEEEEPDEEFANTGSAIDSSSTSCSSSPRIRSIISSSRRAKFSRTSPVRSTG